MVLSLEQLAANDLAKERLVIPFEHRVILPQAYHVITLDNGEQDERVRCFRDWLFREVETMSRVA